MKKLTSILVAVALAAFVVGCTTSQQTTTYNALASVESIADTGYSNYVGLVISGTAPTNQLPQVSKAYNDLHAAIIAASALDQAGTNFFVPTNITIELTDFVNLITTATQSK